MVAALLLAACDPPSPLVRLRLADGPVGQCPSTSCADVPNGNRPIAVYTVGSPLALPMSE